MIPEADLLEYLEEIRQEVCSRCVERPEGGPPCAPFGKVCGVELHLLQLVEAVREVHSDHMGPYLDSTRRKVCQSCPYLHESCCPCPMDSLALLVVEAIEAVDARHRRRHAMSLIEGLPGVAAPGLEAVVRAYEEASGTWTGCDWPTSFGPDRLDLNGVSATGAREMATRTAGRPEAAYWAEAAGWAAEVEHRAEQAEREAALAVAAATAGAWEEAIGHARKAWGLEFYTGRPLHRAPAWQALFQAVKATAREHARVGLVMAR
jgi:hypothetical protein